MYRKTVTVGSKIGLHARPAALIAEAAAKYDTEISLQKLSGDPVEADSALMIMTLGAECGSEITVISEDEAATADIAALIASDLDTL